MKDNACPLPQSSATVINDPNNIFRSAEFWKSTLITMPDNSFFELMRSVFGKIKTPFKKQQLVNDLENFLLREDIQKTITTYVDQNDAKVIAATALFGEPAPGDLESFFSGEISYTQLHDIIVNLEERFILYRFTENTSRVSLKRIALNPVLKQVLMPFVQNISPLFHIQKQNENNTANAPQITIQFPFNDRILAAIFSFVSSEEQFFRSEIAANAAATATFSTQRRIRKKIIEKIKIVFPDMDMEIILGSLQVLGLLYADGDKLIPDKKRFDDFGLLSIRERNIYCTAALLVYNEASVQKEIFSPLYRNKILEYSNFIHCFMSLLETKYIYKKDTLYRLVGILKTKINNSNNIDNDNFLDILEKTGLVYKQSNCKDSNYAGIGNMNAVIEAEKHERPAIAIDSGFSVVVFPGIEYTDAISLAKVLEIKEAGAYASSVVRFQLSKEAAVQAFNRNNNSDNIIDLLIRLSGSRIDDNLIWTLKDWEKQYKEVSLKKGIVLSLSEDRRYLTEIMPLAELIRETLAPGLYLLPEGVINEAASALQSAGIDIIGREDQNRLSIKKTNNTSSVQANRYFSAIASAVTPPKRFIPLDESVSTAELSQSSHSRKSEASILTAGFRAILEKIQMGAPERAELSARIDRRLVLCEEQLKDTDLRYEKLEARNMDYTGKQNIARQAIAQRSPVEIEISLHGKEKSELVFGIPKTLEKENEKLFLVIEPDNEKGQLRIPLGKISLIRRIKKSIFQ